jgi:hypothetical protein
MRGFAAAAPKIYIFSPLKPVYIRLTSPLPWVTIPSPAEVAQLVEHLTENQGVTSSILVLGTSQNQGIRPDLSF